MPKKKNKRNLIKRGLYRLTDLFIPLDSFKRSTNDWKDKSSQIVDNFSLMRSLVQNAWAGQDDNNDKTDKSYSLSDDYSDNELAIIRERARNKVRFMLFLIVTALLYFGWVVLHPPSAMIAKTTYVISITSVLFILWIKVLQAIRDIIWIDTDERPNYRYIIRHSISLLSKL